MTSPIRPPTPRNQDQEDLRKPMQFTTVSFNEAIEKADTKEELDNILLAIKQKKHWMEREIEEDIRRRMFENVIGRKK